VSGPSPTLSHLARMADGAGVFEHAEFSSPRTDIGYCTDDAGRLLALAVDVYGDANAAALARLSLSFLERAHIGDGVFRLRQRASGEWTSDPTSDDANARALVGLATAAADAPWSDVKERASALFERASVFRSRYPRASAYAVVGAARWAHNPAARQLIVDAAGNVVRSRDDPHWPWPEARLTYANALLPHAALVVASVLDDDERLADALGLLAWLVERETLDGHFSFTPVDGRDAHSLAPSFDQQPVEAWAMIEACAFAFSLTGDERWVEFAERAGEWFIGHNDVGVALYDPRTGGGYDGLGPEGPNLNQGAESTIAFNATMLRWGEITARRPLQAARRASSR
jgi:hypothetical protein